MIMMQTKRDVAILEEPEHLSWFNRSFRWSLEFNHVIGAVKHHPLMPAWCIASMCAPRSSDSAAPHAA